MTNKEKIDMDKKRTEIKQIDGITYHPYIPEETGNEYKIVDGVVWCSTTPGSCRSKTCPHKVSCIWEYVEVMRDIHSK